MLALRYTMEYNEGMKKILCLGDSLTYGYGVSRRDTWTSKVQDQGKYTVVNAGCSGNTTGGMLACFPRELEKHRPDILFAMGGGNNIFFAGTDAGARADMAALVHLSYPERVEPVLGIAPAIHPPIRRDWAALVDEARTMALWEDYADWLRRFCDTFGIRYVDFHRRFPEEAARQGVEMGAWFLEDGMHPNTAGHQVLAEIFAAEMEMAR